MGKNYPKPVDPFIAPPDIRYFTITPPSSPPPPSHHRQSLLLHLSPPLHFPRPPSNKRRKEKNTQRTSTSPSPPSHTAITHRHNFHHHHHHYHYHTTLTLPYPPYGAYSEASKQSTHAKKKSHTRTCPEQNLRIIPIRTADTKPSAREKETPTPPFSLTHSFTHSKTTPSLHLSWPTDITVQSATCLMCCR
ncbi:hypothetical protein L873DRAFT_1823238 [Choiromyces venosus 120613-1]|uniref:Uncharacterized protein n=1 Tax=Choiromyces venosus 120613-1 TaxID=1336337 RepID=A0A3N4IWB0_9PEZI|nr:hypothetical protein L873DRAFT_1823238 [Choiromyces venosus 120613-1]